MRKEIVELVAMGALPPSSSKDMNRLARFQDLILSIQRPVSNEEAEALVNCFGPDDCFGLAWELLHLIETAPGWPIAEVLNRSTNEWTLRWRDRTIRAKIEKGT